MDVLARLTELSRLTGLARLLYKTYVFSNLRLHGSARQAGPARFERDPGSHYRASPVSRAGNAHVIAFVPPNRAKIAATHKNTQK